MMASENVLEAAWLDGGRIIALISRGSSSSIPFADAITHDGQSLAVHLTNPDGPATRDFRPRVSLISVPQGVKPTRPLSIEVTGAVTGSATVAGTDALPAVPDEFSSFAPSAAWIGAGGQFVVLTYGSSIPALRVDSVAKTGESLVTVTFSSRDTGGMATMDMAPRAHLCAIADPITRPADVVLTGTPSFTGQRIPILG